MTDETKPNAITSQPSKSDVSVGTAGPMENKRDGSSDQPINVVALKTFHRDGDMKGEMVSAGDAFEVPRHRAAQLRANGLIEYANESDDHAIHGEHGAKLIGEKVKLNAEASAIPANSKGTPLRNPEVKLGDVKGK